MCVGGACCIEIEEGYIPPVAVATREAVSPRDEASPRVDPQPVAQPPFPSAPREGGGPGFPPSLHHPALGPLRVEWGEAATPEAFPPLASYPEACFTARACPASRAFAAAAQSPPSLPEPTEPS